MKLFDREERKRRRCVEKTGCSKTTLSSSFIINSNHEIAMTKDLLMRREFSMRRGRDETREEERDATRNDDISSGHPARGSDERLVLHVGHRGAIHISDE